MIFDISNTKPFVDEPLMDEARQEAARAMLGLIDDYEHGAPMLGWLSLPADIRPSIDSIEQCANRLRRESEAIVICGIGGSLLGAYAVIKALAKRYDTTGPEILFAGHNLSQDYIIDMAEHLSGHRYSIICISKSGTTLETAIAFRILRQQLEREQGAEYADGHIVCITDPEAGALHDMALKHGYTTFPVPGNVGGRYSVLSAVGLLPIAAAGFDIRQLVAGAFDYYRPHRGYVGEVVDYAALRNTFYRAGKKIELFVSYEPRLQGFARWWQQLFGESEGKDGKGIFPATAVYTTELHSLGQLVQQGERTLFETTLSVEKSHREMEIPRDAENIDKLNKYSWYTVGYINSASERGTAKAHRDGGVPGITIRIPQINEYSLGQLLYFFELSAAVSGRMLGVNPFDQPGVDAYKQNIRKLL